jgi:nucleoside-diphosphate-sugar epimerase
MRIVVVGATGNVGTSVVDALRADASVDSVVGLARRAPTATLPKVEWAAADVASSDLEAHFRGADAVVHLAWVLQRSHDVEGMARVNVGGSARVFEAVAAAHVPALVYASSVGAYSPGPKDRAVDESWPTEGVPSSFYSRHKVAVERLLDRFEADHPSVRVVRLRPALIFKREAASGIRRVFFGPFVPTRLLRPSLLAVVPRAERLVVQAVHTSDVAAAYRAAVLGDARGAFNIAADPVLDGEELGRILGARPVAVPARVMRAAADLSWRARVQPTPPGWVDLALEVPVLDSSRARRELGWEPRWSAGEALLDLLGGLAAGAEAPTPALARRAVVPALPGPDSPAAARTAAV